MGRVPEPACEEGLGRRQVRVLPLVPGLAGAPGPTRPRALVIVVSYALPLTSLIQCRAFWTLQVSRPFASVPIASVSHIFALTSCMRVSRRRVAIRSTSLGAQGVLALTPS
jgi:hypothetical protein